MKYSHVTQKKKKKSPKKLLSGLNIQKHSFQAFLGATIHISYAQLSIKKKHSN